ncbi:phosphoribosylaminoimidazolesuccinocarboxamide synthase [bacterium CG17_big_fil_post_rev_8_21_14_2_50_64_8]|nr:MAG: phosphoribosylaminoimidazolesuccinocarboxamide synthase [bacterium CG17_big_fil_post_rev_8_21_14_2_50_64_8]PJA75497.1 MAG: phosphoribosylaminoimidazolesuccinocarboxamide synthase [bacterium CG_4_9_14_3_um_filter_65_15]
MPAFRSSRDLGLTPDFEGKVRDLFDLGDQLLIVTTDRISAFDVVMDQVVPGRGVVLNAMALGWFDYFRDVIPNHVLTTDPAEFPAAFAAHGEALAGRALLVRKAERYDVECVVRGYIAGSGWKSYGKDGTICGHRLPDGLRLAEQLPEPLFTPSTKAATGHDENIPYAEMERLVGGEAAARMRDVSLSLYAQAADRARDRGVIIADTKFEFGLVDGRLILIDEALTPDSSRFWPAEGHTPGGEPESWDKQILRNFLETCDWNKEAPGPHIPAEVLERTSRRYREVLDILFPQEAKRWAAYL